MCILSNASLLSAARINKTQISQKMRFYQLWNRFPGRFLELKSKFRLAEYVKNMRYKESVCLYYDANIKWHMPHFGTRAFSGNEIQKTV